ncbi:MAG: hypothetical protein AB7N65_22265 [Vicinamibacterales bacterium]
MKPKQGRVTAEELLRSLSADPEFVAKREQEESERQARAAAWRVAEAPLVAELNDAGFGIASVWDLVNSSESYLDALPILVDHLQRAYPSRVREGIARALAVPEARFAWGVLVDLYRAEDSNDAKDGLAIAIAAAADDAVLEEVISLIGDRRHGSSRVLLLSALERSHAPRARAALAELEADPELKKEIRTILRRTKRRTR